MRGSLSTVARSRARAAESPSQNAHPPTSTSRRALKLSESERCHRTAQLVVPYKDIDELWFNLYLYSLYKVYI